MAKSGLALKGVRQMQRELKRLEDTTDQAALQALNIKAGKIMTTSKKKYVPVDEGVLRSSGVVGKAEKQGKKYIVEFWFGGAASAYALAIHEHPSASSPPSWKGKEITFSPRGRGPKYLKKAIDEAVIDFRQEVGAFVKAKLEKKKLSW